MRQPSNQVHTDDLPNRQPPVIAMPDDAPIMRSEEAEAIVMVDKPITDDYAADIAFMEEWVEICLERGTEENAAEVVPFWVQGRRVDIRCGDWTRIRRKFVEVIARAQPQSVSTHSEKRENREINEIKRVQRKQYPFSVNADSNRGRAWLHKILMES